MKIKLETVTNIVVIIVAVFVASLLIRNEIRTTPKPQFPKNGDQLEIIQLDLPSLKTPRLILIAASSKCHYCDQNVDFYRDLQAFVETQKSFDLVCISPDTQGQIDEWKNQNNLSVKTIPDVDLKSLGIGGTPTLLLLEGDKVQRAWVGALSSEKKTDVVQFLNHLTQEMS